jgi:hypothetical protein
MPIIWSYTNYYNKAPKYSKCAGLRLTPESDKPQMARKMASSGMLRRENLKTYTIVTTKMLSFWKESPKKLIRLLKGSKKLEVTKIYQNSK